MLRADEDNTIAQVLPRLSWLRPLASSVAPGHFLSWGWTSNICRERAGRRAVRLLPCRRGEWEKAHLDLGKDVCSMPIPSRKTPRNWRRPGAPSLRTGAPCCPGRTELRPSRYFLARKAIVGHVHAGAFILSSSHVRITGQRSRRLQQRAVWALRHVACLHTHTCYLGMCMVMHTHCDGCVWVLCVCQCACVHLMCVCRYTCRRWCACVAWAHMSSRAG